MSRLATQVKIKQLAEYTFKFNNKLGRHGWLRLTPAYSVKVVNDILVEWPMGTAILDPFAGTSTTALCAGYYGHRATTTELNPFSVWFGKVKLASYKTEDIEEAREVCESLLESISLDSAITKVAPPIHKIERWWDEQPLSFLCKVKGEIEKRSEAESNVRNLLDVAFCRTMIKLSNAAFNHQSMSFKDKNMPGLFDEINTTADFSMSFREDTAFVLNSAVDNPKESARIVEGDARTLSGMKDSEFDLLITSPPYVNRMSYIRELRPYMYWLGFLKEAREAGELDWKAIGGTWGIATSRLSEWQSDKDTYRPKDFDKMLEVIRHSDNKNGVLLSNYVDKYFEDMWKHFENVKRVMKPGGHIHYIVGNSTFYGCLVPAEKIYAQMLEKLGFTNVEVHLLRKRNSKKALYEYDVVAQKPR
jgi:DNA modification methylase